MNIGPIVVEGPIDSIEVALYHNGSSATGSREFFFNNLRIETAVVPGDFDSDDDVDGADFVIWQTHFPTTNGGNLSTGDADADGDIDGADFVLWQTNFPSTPGLGSVLVPEPASVIAVSFLILPFLRKLAAVCD